MLTPVLTELSLNVKYIHIPIRIQMTLQHETKY